MQSITFEILKKSLEMLEKYPLCDHCLGRQFAMLGYNMSNGERGRLIKTLLAMEGHRLTRTEDSRRGVHILKKLAANGSLRMASEILKRTKRRADKGEICYLCNGHFEFLDELAESALNLLKDYEYETFLVGVKVPVEIAEKEDEFKAEFGIEHSENMKNELSREIGKIIQRRTGKKVDYMRPEIVILVDPFEKEINLQINPLFIMGRYRKLVRGIPQSKWICMRCGGKGCERCNWTGKMYPESVEELISKPILEETSGEDTSFHAAGREDVDARMLGRGRPFIIEVKKPKRRFLDLQLLEERINREAEGKVEVSDLRFVDRNMVRKLKQLEGSEKLYKVIVEFNRELSDEELKLLEESFTDVLIKQRTPLRVLHRRADLEREKYIYETKISRLTKNKIVMRIRCQGGLYIKELITGDEGRTRPNVAETIKAEPSSLKLDVLNVYVKGRRKR